METQPSQCNRQQWVSVIAFVCLFSFSVVHGQMRSADHTSLAAAATTRRLLTSLKSTRSAEGIRIVVEASLPLNGAVSYRSGNRFVIVIPQAEAAGMQIDLGSLTNFQVDSHEEDVSLSFKLDPGADANFKQNANQIIVSISRQLAAGEARSETASAAGAVVNTSMAPSTPVTRASVLPVAAAAPTPLPTNVDGLINALSGFIGPAPKINLNNLDLSVPESPAFAVLNLTPQTIIRPASPQAFATSLLNGLDKKGNFQSGLAIDTAPFLLVNGKDVTLADYNSSLATRLLTRTQFSFAVAKGATTDDKTTKLSLGFNLTLFDNGDPRVYRPNRYDPETKVGDVLLCFRDSLQTPSEFNGGPFRPLPDDATDAQRTAYETRKKNLLDALDTKNNAAADKCREINRKANWNKSSWTIAFAPSWISKTGNSSDFTWHGGAFWTSYAYGFEGVDALKDIAQLILHARYRNQEQVPDPAKKGSFISQDSVLFGGRFRVGNPDFGLNVEGSFISNQPAKQKTTNTYEFSLGAEKKLAPNVYFVITAGSQGDQQNNSKSHGFVLTSFKYGFSKAPQIATPSN